MICKKCQAVCLTICMILALISQCLFVETSYGAVKGRAARLEAPTLVQASSIGKREAQLEWMPVKGAAGYKVYQRVKKNRYKKIKTIKGRKNTMFVAEGLNSKKMVFFKVRAYGKGKGNQVNGAFSYEVSVRPKGKNVRQIQMVPEAVTMETGGAFPLEIITSPKKPAKSAVKWSSSNPAVASVNKYGVVIGRAKGKVQIHARSHNGYQTSCVVEVEVPPSGIQMTDRAVSISYGEVKQLYAKVLPADAANAKVRWFSKNKTVATVNQHGRVTAMNPGNAEIGVKVEDHEELQDICEVKVTEDNGFLTAQRLQTLGLDSAHKLMIVAHPDDETIWGGLHLLEEPGNYFVLCLTNGYNVKRTNEFYSVMAEYGSKGLILNYPDYFNRKKDDWSGVCGAIEKDINRVVRFKKWDSIVTHNPAGEYGHIHHRMTNKIVTKVNGKQRLQYFGKYYWRVPSTAAPGISQEHLQKKYQIMDLYQTQRGALNNLRHMAPYENWVDAADWQG